MKTKTREKIKKAVSELESIGGLNDPDVKKVIDKLKKALKDEEESKE